MPILTESIGYTGKVAIDSKIILATGGSVSIQHSPMFSTGIWGATWKNATDKIAYAPNYVTLSANVNYQLTGNIAGQIATFAFSARNKGANCQIYPDNKSGFSGKMYCTGCGFSTAQDSLVTGDISFKGGVAFDSTSSVSFSSTSSITQSLNNASTNYTDVFPYWASGVHCTTGDSSRDVPAAVTNKIRNILSWNATYSSDLIFAGKCTGTSTMLDANYCALGMMDAQGSFTVIGINDDLKPSTIQNTKKVTIKMGTTNNSQKYQILFGNVVWQDGSFDVQTGTSLVQSTMNFKVTPPTE